MSEIITQCEVERGTWRERWTAVYEGIYYQIRLRNLGVRDLLLRPNCAADYNFQNNVVLHSNRLDPSLCDFLSW
jgi:hypothetical protein